MQEMKIKVVHIISSMQLGGVEKGINLSIEELNAHFDYKVATLSNNNSFYNKNLKQYFIFSKSKYILFSIIPVLHQLRNEKPDVMILSLWKSYLVGFLAKYFLRKQTKIIAFIHNEKYFHWADKCFTQLILKKADIIAFDSQNSQKAFQHLLLNTKQQFVIPYIFNSKSSKKLNLQDFELPIRFLYAGRLHESKNLEKVFEFFAEFKKIEPQFVFDIYGSGSQRYQKILIEKILQLQLEYNINFKGVFDSIQTTSIYTKYHFYIQLSKNEGMAMSVVDAMIHGVIPIVTPVGEINNYVTDSVNGFIVHQESSHQQLSVIGNKIHELFNNQNAYLQIQQNCMQQFNEHRNYNKAFIKMIHSSRPLTK